MKQKNIAKSTPIKDNLTRGDVLSQLYETMKKEELFNQYKFPDKPDDKGFYRVNVKKIHSKTGKRTTVCGKSIEELKTNLYHAVYQEKPKPIFCTVAEVFELWQDSVLESAKGTDSYYSVLNTISRSRSEFKRFFGDCDLKDRLIGEVTDQELKDHIRASILRYKLTSKGLASLRALLSGIFRYAYTNHMISDNITTYIDYKSYRYILRKGTPIRKRAYTDEQIMAFLNYLHEYQRTHPKYLAPYALELQILLGVRRGEIPPLEWDDITDEDIYISKEQLTVKKTETMPEHFVIVDHTKTKQDRSEPVTTELAGFLERLKKVHEQYYKGSAFLFPANAPNGCITNNVVYDFYRRTCIALGFRVDPDAKMGPHSFRRNAITNFVAASNGNIDLAAQTFGNSPDVIRKHYMTNFDSALKRTIMEKSMPKVP